MFEPIRSYEEFDEKEQKKQYLVQLANGRMFEADTLKDITATVCGREYLDCEDAETEWHSRLSAAKTIGLSILGTEDDARVIVYDERMGKIPYSYTDPNPDYEIPEDPELIRIETEQTFLYSLIKVRYIRIWEKSEDDYKNIANIKNIDQEIKKILEPFKFKKTSIPLHKRLEE